MWEEAFRLNYVKVVLEAVQEQKQAVRKPVKFLSEKKKRELLWLI